LHPTRANLNFIRTQVLPLLLKAVKNRRTQKSSTVTFDELAGHSLALLDLETISTIGDALDSTALSSVMHMIRDGHGCDSDGKAKLTTGYFLLERCSSWLARATVMHFSSIRRQADRLLSSSSNLKMMVQRVLFWTGSSSKLRWLVVIMSLAIMASSYCS
jgi:hypothetical protein